MVSLLHHSLHHSLHLPIAYHNRVNRFPGNRPCLAISQKQQTGIPRFVPTHRPLQPQIAVSEKALGSLNFDLSSATCHRHYQGQHRIRSADNVSFTTSGWAMEPLRQVLGVRRVWIQLANHNFEDCSPLLPEVCWRIVAEANSRGLPPHAVCKNYQKV
jgi:hypothetical protein